MINKKEIITLTCSFYRPFCQLDNKKCCIPTCDYFKIHILPQLNNLDKLLFLADKLEIRLKRKRYIWYYHE